MDFQKNRMKFIAKCQIKKQHVADEIDKELKPLSVIIIAMNSISISTLRGIMFSTLKGAYLRNAILPVIDPKSFHVNK